MNHCYAGSRVTFQTGRAGRHTSKFKFLVDATVITSSPRWRDYQISLSVSESVTNALNLYRRHFSTVLHRTCYQGSVPADVIYMYLLFLVEIQNSYIRQTGSGINFQHFIRKNNFMVKITHKIFGTMLDSVEFDRKSATLFLSPLSLVKQSLK